jgi:hypothetical protein
VSFLQECGVVKSSIRFLKALEKHESLMKSYIGLLDFEVEVKKVLCFSSITVMKQVGKWFDFTSIIVKQVSFLQESGMIKSHTGFLKALAKHRGRMERYKSILIQTLYDLIYKNRDVKKIRKLLFFGITSSKNPTRLNGLISMWRMRLLFEDIFWHVGSSKMPINPKELDALNRALDRLESMESHKMPISFSLKPDKRQDCINALQDSLEELGFVGPRGNRYLPSTEELNALRDYV